MLPISSSLNDIKYPMTADVYYSTQQQNDLGEISRVWSFDRTVMCSAIKDSPTTLSSAFNDSKFIELDKKINFRSNEDISKSSEGTFFNVTEVIVTNIKDPSGEIVWVESDSVATIFEVDNIEPLFNENHNQDGTRSFLIRSDSQGIL